MSEDGLEHVALIQRLDPDRVDDYLAAHEDVPKVVTETMEEAGLKEFRLFVEDDLSIGYMVVEDLERFTEVYLSEPGCQAWEERVGEYKRAGVDADAGEMPVMDEVWTFTPGDG